jgi:hypothetical protein
MYIWLIQRGFILIKRLLTKIGIVGLAVILSLTPFIPVQEVLAGGACVEEDNWVCIDNETELRNMSLDLDGKYKLAADISLTASWTPIGDIITPFIGMFDGNGYIISNMQISFPSSNAGFFGVAQGAIIRNIRLINVHINNTGDSDRVGGIAGLARVNTLIETARLPVRLKL